MPERSFRPCKHAGCPEITRDRSGYCDQHRSEYEQMQRESNRRYEKSRGSAASQGYDAHWNRVRDAYIHRHPLCEDCEEQGKLTPAVLVHHIQPIKEGGAVYDHNNLKSLCNDCHEKIHGKDRWKRRK